MKHWEGGLGRETITLLLLESLRLLRSDFSGISADVEKIPH